MKKMVIIIAIVLAVIMVIGAGAVMTHASDYTIETTPGIVGMEHLEKVVELNKLWENGEFEVDYKITMYQAEGTWIVFLNGRCEEEWMSAFGMYDHMPTDSDLNYLWSQRIDNWDMCDLMYEYFG